MRFVTKLYTEIFTFHYLLQPPCCLIAPVVSTVAEDMNTRIAVLLSGGVDSSVALSLLRQEPGVTLTAYYLKIWLEDELSYLGDCPWEEDLAYARAVCEKLDVPLEVVSLQREYYDRVVQYAINELSIGRTPSPDIFCNQRIKFGVFFERAGSGFDKIASGHYARIRAADGQYHLLRAPDPVKDQTYFLSHLSQAQLSRALFPIGAMKKAEVRQAAVELDLPTKARPDSQGICFLGKIKYPDFVRHYLGVRPGAIVEAESGRTLGEHKGYWFHTIGQRQGLGLGNGPWYVVAKDTARNIIYVSHNEGADTSTRRSFTVGDPSWLCGEPADGRLEVKLRHGPQLIGASISHLEGGRLRVVLDEPDSGIAPGQFSVFYAGEECLGGARIEAADDANADRGPLRAVDDSEGDAQDKARMDEAVFGYSVDTRNIPGSRGELAGNRPQ